jgi:hypothetical protein
MLTLSPHRKHSRSHLIGYIAKELHLKRGGEKTRKQHKKMKIHFALKTLLQKITNHKAHEVNKRCAFCTLHLKFS